MEKTLSLKKFVCLLFSLSFICGISNVTKVNYAAATKYAFFGEQASVNDLVDDDAKAAATWMQQTYGSDFIYIPFSQINAGTLADVKVGMIYYLTAKENVGYTVTPSDVSTMLPTELRTGGSAANALKTWVKNGGGLLIAGDPTPLIFSLGRVPADFSAPRATGNYVYSEFANGGLETKPSDDLWGLGIRPANVAGDIQSDPIFAGLTITDNAYVVLNNSTSREVRLVWWQHFDNILNPSCCGQDAAQKFERVLNAKKYGTLRHITDSFGYAAVLWNRTDVNTDAEMDAGITNDFKGTIFTIENTINGYEWDSNGTTNDYLGNIKTLTKNILDVLTSKTLAVNDIAKKNKTFLYPNPAKDVFTVRSEEAITKVSVLDVNGRIVLSAAPQKNLAELNIQNLAVGNYVVVTETSSSKEAQKLIKK